MEMTSPAPPPHPAEEQPPYILERPVAQTLPLVVASPHSGDYYPTAFLDASGLDRAAIRRSEDCYVHELVASAPLLGAPLLRAVYPRAYLDLNREAYELDPEMFEDPLPGMVNTRSPRVLAGLGTIARIVGNGNPIYRRKLTFSDAQTRIERLYHPYHATLTSLIADTRTRFGYCILLDCHSMPASTVSAGPPLVGFVLGDCHGVSCNRSIADAARSILERSNHRVARNAPYAGGYTTRHYGHPENGVHALQIEINRSLYMNENSYERRRAFSTLQTLMQDLLVGIAHRARLVLDR